MKNLALTGLLAAALLAGCNQQKTTTANTADAKELPALFDTYWEEQAKLFPLAATAQGDNRYNDQLPNDQTRAFRQSLAAFYQRYLTQLGRFEREKLSANDRTSYDIFQYDLQTRLDGLQQGILVGSDYPAHWMIPFSQFGGLPISLGQFGAGTGSQPFKTAKDYDNWLGRVHGFPVWADSAISNFRAGMRASVVLPRALVQKMIPQMRALVVTDPAKSLFYGPISTFPKDLAAADRPRLTTAYQQAIGQELVPAYRKLADFLEQEYLPKARATTGISALPAGPEQYRFLVKYWTTTDKTPEEIYRTGRSEVARIRTEMERVKAQTGFKGDLKAFFEYMKTDRRFMPYKSPEQVLSAFRGIQARITPNLKKMFGRTPKTGFEVRQTEAFRAASASAEYNPGTPDGSRPGIFYVPILDATTFNTTSGMESLFLHEAIPGHHYQVSLQQENESLPKFRRFAWYGAMGEGWAMYTESLGKELGLYTDPYQYMGALGDEIHRAIRLVVDVGMHTQNLTREQAIDYMMANEAIGEQGATAEIERYMAIPGQALSYKIGSLKIGELRRKYEQQLGPGAAGKLREKYPHQNGNHFHLNAFHDELLRDGVMPLAVLERKMDDWAAGEK
ncbi:Uncharacterized conserved protein, DUF885 familyt [Hymenobacter daecheongensis DSM 21074]|uniref:Uncharacterized conserved protein, DUF885 familyt n=1 Tax=Hymenobacter daecheongensis DSM 21074 TaxID=1121955 RepID=A0A1M6MF88_9BACT|nr:DUF885 domain-containing protein [Hymenobacter daecheongensis]SHJ82013.1 Uncharacterized conserved protein, DUF885 familyt [Hymenobacter daecheongensis DSM 21074]